MSTIARRARRSSLLCFLLAAGVLACTGGAESDDGAGPDGDAPELWPWLGDYESPGCSQPGVFCATFVDARDGQTYRSVTIGEQTWMGTSLDHGEFSEGGDAGTDGGVPKQCPMTDPEWCDRAGAEYLWHTAMALPECDRAECQALVQAPHRGICPDGWHLPTVEEVRTLLEAIGTTSGPDCDTGAALKSTEGWVNSGVDDVSTDSSGLSVLPQTMVPRAGTVWVTRAGIWTASIDARGAYVLMLSIGDDCARLERYWTSRRAHGVRCVKD